MLACSSLLFGVFGLLACTAPVPTCLPCLPSYHDLPSGACAAAGKPRGYAFIEYEHKDDMKQVNEVHVTLLLLAGIGSALHGSTRTTCSRWACAALVWLHASGDTLVSKRCAAWEHTHDMKQVVLALVC